MNTIITNYTFNATAKTITLTDFTSVDVKRVRFIKNLTTNSFIFKFTDALTITAATNVITFTGANTGMNNTDQLSIQYDMVNGSMLSSQSMPVALPIEQVQDLLVTGQSGQSAVGQNIILSTAGTGSFDTLNPSTGVSYRSWYMQIISTGTSGAVTFEGSNDNTSFVLLNMFNELNSTGGLASSTSISAGSIFYSGKTSFRYVRARISTIIGGGSIQAITKFSAESYIPKLTYIGGANAYNVNTVVLQPIPNTDFASTVITTTTISIAIATSAALSYSVMIPVTVVSGTTPTMDVTIEESDDTGTNWFTVYSFPRITTTGVLRSPKLPTSGNRYRYVQTISGTTPSFTRSIVKTTYQDPTPVLRQLIDRTIVLTTLGSITPSLLVLNTTNVQLVVNIGTTTIAPVLQLEGSDDNGSTWYSIGTSLTSIASSTVQLTVNNIATTLLRARVSTAGTSTVMGSITLKGF